MPLRRLPQPWPVDAVDACFAVRDHDGQQLAYGPRSRDARPSVTDDVYSSAAPGMPKGTTSTASRMSTLPELSVADFEKH